MQIEFDRHLNNQQFDHMPISHRMYCLYIMLESNLKKKRRRNSFFPRTDLLTFVSALARPGVRNIHDTIIPINKSTP